MLVDVFNEVLKNISASYLKVGDDLMSYICFTTAKGDLTHVSYIFHNPEPLGTEFKTLACCVTWYLLFI